MMMAQQHHRGLSRVEVLVSAICGLALLSIAAFTVQQQKPSLHPDSLEDAKQQEMIFKGMVTFSRQFNGIFPRPGFINRLAFNGVETPGLGAEDPARNTTANLFSSLIAQNFFAPEILISPVERNPRIEIDSDYDHNAFKPADDVYWDPAFAADLETGSNVSYAHMPLWGKRGRDQWRDTVTPASLKFLNEQGVEVSDNLFATDAGLDGDDRLITFTKSIDPATNIGEIQFD
jgi:hypothetical protein